jgi:hypothetical protein
VNKLSDLSKRRPPFTVYIIRHQHPQTCFADIPEGISLLSLRLFSPIFPFVSTSGFDSKQQSTTTITTPHALQLESETTLTLF